MAFTPPLRRYPVLLWVRPCRATNILNLLKVKSLATRDPELVASEVEAAGRDGMNAPFTLPASEYGSSVGGG